MCRSEVTAVDCERITIIQYSYMTVKSDCRGGEMEAAVSLWVVVMDKTAQVKIRSDLKIHPKPALNPNWTTVETANILLSD